jgi:gluconolactonase
MIRPLTGGRLTRRSLITATATLIPGLARAQAQGKPALGKPPTVISHPPRQWGRFAPPEVYPDPDILVIDPSFKPNTVHLDI